MAFGRRYGLVGRNGTGKTTLLRAMAQHQIKGIPENCQILHVEQEVSILNSTSNRLAERDLLCVTSCNLYYSFFMFC